MKMIQGGNAWQREMENAAKREIAVRNQSYQWKVINTKTKEVVAYRWNKTAAQTNADAKNANINQYAIQEPDMNGHIIHGHLTVVAPLT